MPRTELFKKGMERVGIDARQLAEMIITEGVLPCGACQGEGSTRSKPHDTYAERRLAATRLELMGRTASSAEEIIVGMWSVMNGNAPHWLRVNLAIELTLVTREGPTKPEIEKIRARLDASSARERLAGAKELLARALFRPDEEKDFSDIV